MKASNMTRTWSVAVVLGLTLAGCGGAATSSDAPSPAGASSAPSASIAPTAHASIAPTAHASPAAPATGTTGLDGAILHGAAATGDGVVAVGSDGHAAAWASSDGMTWRPIEVAEAHEVEALHAVALHGEGAGVAFGTTDPEPSRAWSASAESPSWTPLESSGIDGRVSAVAAHHDSWVAVGDIVDRETVTTTAGAMWTSEDGMRWEPRTELPLNEGTISDVAVAGDTVVIAGFDVDGGRIWISNSGGDVEEVDGGPFDVATIEGVTHTDAGYVALGRTLGELRPVVWTSQDGSAWERTELSDAAFPPELQINDLTTLNDGLVAVGAGPDGGVVWTSEDGTSWTLHGP